MVNLIVDISKYLMILLMALYTYYNFRFFAFKDEKKKKRICRRQNHAMLLIHLLAYVIIWLKTGDERVIAFYMAQLMFFLCYIFVYRLFYKNVSRLLVNNMCMLLAVGFIILTRLSFDKALKQFVIVVAVALLTWIIPFIIDRMWQKFYMGDDGTFTFYIDMIERKFAKSSTAPFNERYELLHDVTEMFNKIKS